MHQKYSKGAPRTYSLNAKDQKNLMETKCLNLHHFHLFKCDSGTYSKVLRASSLKILICRSIQCRVCLLYADCFRLSMLCGFEYGKFLSFQVIDDIYTSSCWIVMWASLVSLLNAWVLVVWLLMVFRILIMHVAGWGFSIQPQSA